MMKTLTRSRFAIALCAAGFASFAANAATADDTAAVIEDLKRRINALEQQVKAQQAAPPAATVAAAPSASAATSTAAPATGDFKLTWGGYAKFDVLSSRFSDAAVAQGTGRDFYVPSAIPVTAPGVANGREYTDFSAKETRLFLKGEGNVLGYKTGAYVEFDFISGQISQATGGAGNKAITNAYNPALRRAFITFENWEFGQDWSNFQNLVAQPESLDFVAWPTDGTVFVRQPQIRYTTGGFSVSLESPETTVALRRAAGAATFANTNDNTVPDVVAKYDLKSAFGEFTASGIVRQLTDRATVGTANDTNIGFGGSLAGKIPTIGHDDLRFTLSGGQGIGRYLAINTVGDAVIGGDNQLHSPVVFNGFLAYRHPWNEQWRTNLILSAFHANTGKTSLGSDYGGDYSRNIRSAAINLLYSPIPKLTFGGEFRYARRDTVGDNSGTLERLQFSAKYAF